MTLKIEARLKCRFMNRRIGSWFRYACPVSIVGMLTTVVGNAPAVIGEERESRKSAIHPGAIGFDDVEEDVGLKAVEHEVEDVLLRRKLEDGVWRTLPLRARFGIGFRRRHGEKDDLQARRGRGWQTPPVQTVVARRRSTRAGSAIQSSGS